MQQDLEYTLHRHHHHFRRFSYTFANDNEDDFFDMRFSSHLENHSYDAVISFNFFPLVSNVCEKYHIPYISWCYDSPVRIINTKALSNSCNHVFMFDRKEVNEYQKKGFKNVYHMPLAINTHRLNHLFESSSKKYACDVSFLGNLHHGNFPDFLQPLPPYELGYIQSLINIQKNLSGTFVLELINVPSLLARLIPYYQAYTNDKSFTLSENDFSFLFGKYVTELERIELLSSISQICHMDVYSNKPDSIPSTCHYQGSADYFAKMPFVFRESKINLNPTFHCIRSGISLRALDIMGSEGFLLCNAQDEMFEYFIPNEDFVFYNSIDEVSDIISFYLQHEELREKIAINGCKKCHDLFSYDEQFPKLLKTAGVS